MKKCSVCGREKVFSKNMCQKHYLQFLKYGKALDDNPRTVFDVNEIIINDDFAEIVLYDKKCNEIERVKIDIDDIERVQDMKWCYSNGYSQSSKGIKLHRFIMNCPDDMVVDHINHDTLDNRKSNLRICTVIENGMNRKPGSNNKSGITGVHWSKKSNKWKVGITVNKKVIHLGYFDSLEDAKQSRLQAELKYFGDFSPNRKVVIA